MAGLFPNGFMPAIHNNSDTLLQTGLGLLSGQTGPQQAALGAQGFASGRKAMQAQQQQNKTLQFLQQQFPELATYVQAGMPPAEALKMAYDQKLKAQTPQNPMSTIGKLQADLKAGRINQDQYNQAAAGIGKPLVNVNMGGSSEYNKALDKKFADQYITIQDGAQQAHNKLATLSGLESALNQADYTGAGAETLLSVKQGARALGIDVGNLSAEETARALGNQLALQLRSPSGGAGMPGAMSDKDREFLVASVPSLTKTPQGNARLIGYMKKVEQRNIEVANLAQEYANKHGQIDNGFYQFLSQWSDAHPLFTQSDMAAPPQGGGDPEIDMLLQKYGTQ